MIKEVYKDIYMVDLVLPNNPLKSINIYIIKGKDKTLIIDTGFNIEECKDNLLEKIRELNIEISNVELLITHLHSDHCGLAYIFQELGAKVYAGNRDGKEINEMTDIKYWKEFEKQTVLFDLERDNVFFDSHPGYKYCPKEKVDFTYLSEGNSIQIGEYFFEITDIPGHTPGHIGLYERKNKLFFGGDHILDQITPNIGFWGFKENILALYFNSLAKIYAYDIDYLFPSHRNIIRDHNRRINEIMAHHKERLNEILEILKENQMSVRDIATKMNWRIRAKSGEDFPSPQKWFASSEAMAHLEHLYCMGKLEKNIILGKLYFKLK